jgi:hypothetical protein
MERWNLRLPRRSHHFVLGVASWVRSWVFGCGLVISTHTAHITLATHTPFLGGRVGEGVLCVYVCFVQLHYTAVVHSTTILYSANILHVHLSVRPSHRHPSSPVLSCIVIVLVCCLYYPHYALFCTILSSILYYPTILSSVLSYSIPVFSNSVRTTENMTEWAIGRWDANPISSSSPSLSPTTQSHHPPATTHTEPKHQISPTLTSTSPSRHLLAKSHSLPPLPSLIKAYIALLLTYTSSNNSPKYTQ